MDSWLVMVANGKSGTISSFDYTAGTLRELVVNQIGTDGTGPIYTMDIRRLGFLDWQVVAVDYIEPDWGGDGCVDPEGC